METKTKTVGKTTTESFGVTETQKIRVLPNEEQGDYNLISRSIPSAWDLNTKWGMEVREKLMDLLIDEANELIKKEKDK